MIIRYEKLLSAALFIILTAASWGKEPEYVYSAGKERSNAEARNKTLIAMGDYEYPPFEYSDSDGNPSGFNIDIIRSVAAAMHLDIKITLGPWNEVREKLERGEIDIVTGMFKTHDREKKADFTIPHFISTYVIFVRDGSSIKTLGDIRGRDVIVQEGDLGHDFILEYGTAGRIITKKNWSDTLSALSRGEGDCAVAALLQGLILIDKLGIENVKPLDESILQRNYCIAVKEGDSNLLARLNEGLNIIKISGEYDRIYEKWFGVYETKKFYNHPYFHILGPLFILVIFASAGVYFWNIVLQKKVREKVRALNTELENSNKIRNQLQDSLTELARSKEEALQSKMEAEKSNEAKSFFLAGVSHELRTPLNGIIGMTNLLYGTGLTGDQKSLLDMLKASADNLFRLMADLLEFSRVASGKFRIEVSPVNLDDFVFNTTSVVRMLAEEKGLSFQVKNSAPNRILLMDKDRLGQVVFNLAGNAVKYTAKGGITMDISYNGVLQIVIADTGIGIESGLKDEIFNPFTQINSEGSVKNKGLGLGLAIVRLLVETFGGSIDVESEPGKGSRFTVRIPCRCIELQSTETAAVTDAHYHISDDLNMDKLSVLVVEDDPVNRVYLERILGKRGLDIEITDNGDDAVEKTKQKRFNVILMDLNLPGVDGLTASVMIRDFEKNHGLPHSAIIAVTAHAYPEDMAKCLEAGMDGYLSKPFTARKLIEEMQNALGIAG